MKMSRVATLALGAWVAMSVVGCKTSFIGSAHFPGGALGCFKQCQKVGMDMASYVYVGEYSTACACKPKVATVAGNTSEQQADIESNEASVVAAAAGVELQRRQDDEGRRRSQQQ